jgi:threonylcarbamoyladenosine tRNA methylthiotransferase MtaB
MRDVHDLKRLRLSSLDPVEMDDDLWDLIAHEPRLMPHLHMSLQAGDDMVLKRMKRRHLRSDAIAMCERARSLRPDIVFGADIIAGFPTETDDMFQNTYDLVQECNLTFLHIFPYSARNGTPAAKMPQVDMAVRKDRAARLRELGAQQLQKFLHREVGQVRSLVIENDQTGRSEHFAQVKLDSEHKVGSLVQAKIIGIDGDKLTAKTL